MAKIGKAGELTPRDGKTSGKPQPLDQTKTPAPSPADDDYEDGDIATPKRDDCGPDDEPL